MKMNMNLKVCFLVLLPFAVSAQGQPEKTANRGIPQWLADEWTYQTQGTGVWIADNSPFKNDQEPFDAYGIQWEWGPGKTSVKGRLFCLQNGKDVYSVWQFFQYWDIETQQARIIQVGSHGVVGQGVLTPIDKNSTQSVEKFFTPDGSSFDSGHHTFNKAGEVHTQSFDIAGGKWEKRRLYIWKLKTD